MAKSRTTSQKTNIVADLLVEAKRIKATNAVDRGFRTRLAKKYGLTRQRITQIAKAYVDNGGKA